MKRMAQDRSKFIATIILVLGSVIMVFPLIWMISTAFKIPSQIISYPPNILPKPPTLQHFNRLLEVPYFGSSFLNSAYIASLVAAISVFTSTLVGYVFAKFRFFGRDVIFIMILSTMMIPFPVTMIPLFLVVSTLGFGNSHAALIVPFLYSTFGIFLMRQFMSTVPNELREAAIIEGCTEFRAFRSIILPQCMPAISALSIFQFMWHWESFVWPLILIQSTAKFTLPVFLATFSNEWWTDYGLVMAGATITIFPILIVFFFFQKQIIRGMALTGLKL